MGTSSSSNVIQVQPIKARSSFTDTKPHDIYSKKILKKWKKLGVPANFTPVTACVIFLRINWLILPAGNLKFPHNFFLGKIAFCVWVFNCTANFVFDSYEAYKCYGFAWASTRLLDWFIFCLGTYLLQTKIVTRIETGLNALEQSGDYSKTLYKMGYLVKRLTLFIVGFSICGCSLVYGLLRLDKAINVGFGQGLTVSAQAALQAWRLLSTLHVLYVFALLWLLPVFVMQMTGYAMIEYREALRSRLRSKQDALTFEEAVLGFKDRIQFADNSSSACMVLLTLLFLSALLSFVVNGYVFLYKTRLVFLVWGSLMPLGFALFPLRTAGWVTKQYHKHLVSVVKAWVERPESSSSESDEDESEESEEDEIEQVIQSHSVFTDKKHNESMNQVPNTGWHSNTTYSTADTDEQRKHTFSFVLKGAVKTLGRWQMKRKLPKFNFEKYVLYLDKISKGTGFSVIGVIVTWELVSSILFFCFSIVALFLQESIFGKLKLAQ